MSKHSSTISAFQKILSKVKPPELSGDFPTQFALKRFAKKFEIPEHSTSSVRKLKTFEHWLSFDQSLKPIVLPHGAHYRARLVLSRVLKDFRIGELTFTNGSSASPLFGMHSVADKLLTHEWEVSPRCADLFVNLAVNDKAFLKAAKLKVRRSHGDDRYREEVRRIYNYRRSSTDVKKWLLYSCLVCRDDSRFSVVRKNNTIDRAIDMQPFINMLVQRAIGLGIREVLKKHFDLNLENTQPIHGSMIRDLSKATVDMKNASDAVSWSMSDFLLPAWFVTLLRDACPSYTYGLDGHFHVTNKVSSMGNGFTFELMTLILIATVREFDNCGSVFGDDIVVDAKQAPELIRALESTGWIVNREKSFLDGPFRESCGYNYHQDHGYFRSFDFYWPETIGDCITFWNKCVLLEHIPFFKNLTKLLYRALPKPLRGPIPSGVTVGPIHESDIVLDSYFFDKKFKLSNESFLAEYADKLNYPNWSYHEGVEFRSKVRFRKRDDISMRRSAHLYFQYMFAGRRCDIVLTGKGDWVNVGFLTNGQYSIRVKTLKKLYD